MTLDRVELAVLATLSTMRGICSRTELSRTLQAAGLRQPAVDAAVLRLLQAGRIEGDGSWLSLTAEGSLALLQTCAEVERAIDNSPSSADQEDCPSIPWLTTVQTEWIDAVSINYAVEPEVLSRLLPAPLQPEVFEGSAWVQVLVSSLREMRPQGLGGVFGVDFYQVSYRAAVRYRSADGTWRRGGYFVRSDTNHAVMRAVGNTLAEFKFHEFGGADMLMVREGDTLTIGIDAHEPGGKLVATFDTRPQTDPPPGSVWASLHELQMPLVECYDAYGVDHDEGYLYTLTIDREPWNARFVRPRQLYCEYVDTGPLGGGVARLDSVLHIPRCAYRWRPLRRERLARTPGSSPASP